MYSEDKSIFNSFEYTINKRSHDLLVKFLVLRLLNNKIEDVRKSKGYAAQQPLLKTRKIYFAITHELPQRKWKIRRKLFPSQGDLFSIRKSWHESNQHKVHFLLLDDQQKQETYLSEKADRAFKIIFTFYHGRSR